MRAAPLPASLRALAQPLRRGAATTTIVTSPFINSITLSRAAGSLVLRTAGGLAASATPLAADEPLAAVAARLRGALNARSVRFLVAGAAAGADARVTAAWGRTLEVDVDGVRFSVNGGLRLSPSGAGVPRSDARVALAWWGGGLAAVVAAASFWHAVIPAGHSRLA